VQHSEEDGRRVLTQRGSEITEPPVVAPPPSVMRKKKGGEKEKPKESIWWHWVFPEVLGAASLPLIAVFALLSAGWALCLGKKPKKKRRKKKAPKAIGEQP
jgi:hypothetical protein